MKSWWFQAVTYEGAVYCTDCLPLEVEVTSEDVHPIFANSEWDYYPTCNKCGKEHDYVTLLNGD